MLAHHLYRKPRILALSQKHLLGAQTRRYSVAVNTFTQGHPIREQKEEGSIASVFTSLSGDAVKALPGRFADLKKEIWKDSLVQSWREVLAELETAVDEVAAKGPAVSLQPVFAMVKITQIFVHHRPSHEYLMRTSSVDYHQTRFRQLKTLERSL